MTDHAILGAFDLTAEIERFRPGEGASGRRAETLVKTDRLRLVLVTMRAGSALEEHTSPGPITIQPLRGRFAVTVRGREHELNQNGLIALDAGVPHAVRALDGGAFLLTICWQVDGERAPLPTDAPSGARSAV